MFKGIANRKTILITTIILVAFITFGVIFILSKNQITSEKMVKHFSNNNLFSFNNISWLSTKEQVLKHEGIKDKDTKVIHRDVADTNINLIIGSSKPQTFNGSNLKVYTQYEFYNDKFIKGGYYICSDNEKEFKNTVNKVIDEFIKKYGKKYTKEGNYNLKEIPSDENKANAITWISDDKAYLTVSITYKSKEPSISSMPYRLGIYSTVPNHLWIPGS